MEPETAFEESECTKKSGVFPDLDRYLKNGRRHFVTYFEGAAMYGIPYYSFVRLAREAEANYCLRKTAIVDVDKVECFLFSHPDVAERLNAVREV